MVKRRRQKRRTRKAGMLSAMRTRITQTRRNRSPQTITLQFVSMGGEITSIPNLALRSTLSDAITQLEAQNGMIISMVTNKYEALDPTKTLRQLNLQNNTELTYLSEELTLQSSNSFGFINANTQRGVLARCLNQQITFYGKTEYKLSNDEIINGYAGFVDNIRPGHVLSPRPHIMILTTENLENHRGGICKHPTIKKFKSTTLFKPSTLPTSNYEIKTIPRDFQLYNGNIVRQMVFDVIRAAQQDEATGIAVHRSINTLMYHLPVYMYCDNHIRDSTITAILNAQDLERGFARWIGPLD